MLERQKPGGGNFIELSEHDEDLSSDLVLNGKPMLYVKRGAAEGLKLKRLGVDPIYLDPCPACRVYNADDQSFVDATEQIVEFSAADFDEAGMWDADHPARITLPRAGVWMIRANLQWESFPYQALVAAYLRKNQETPGVDGGFGYNIKTALDGSPQVLSVSGVDRFDAGDYVTVFAVQQKWPVAAGAAVKIMGRSNVFFWGTDRYAPVFEAIWMGNK